MCIFSPTSLPFRPTTVKMPNLALIETKRILKSAHQHCLITPPQLTCAEITASPPPFVHTDKKENKIFLKYEEIQMGSVAKSYMRKGFLNMRICAII